MKINKNNINLDKNGQISVEIILLISIILILIVSVTSTLFNENELNKAIISAKNGAYEGASVNGLAIYPKETFEEYMNKSANKLTHTKNIKIIKISKKVQKIDVYNKTRIQIKIYASSPDLKTKEEKESVGDRINYNIRKSISQTFQSENLSNTLYNPAFTPHYSFTTADVQWI